MNKYFFIGLIAVLAVNLNSDACPLSTGTSYRTSATYGPYSVSFSSDSSKLVAANGNSNSITLFNVAGSVSTGLTAYLPTGSAGAVAAVFSPNGVYVATANRNSSDVTIFTCSGGNCIQPQGSYPLPTGSSQPVSIAFSPDGLYLATANNASNDVTVYSVNTASSCLLPCQVLSGAISYPLPTGSSGPLSIAFSPDGSLLVTSNGASDNITLFSVTSGVLSNGTNYSISGAATSVSFSPDGAYLAITTGAGNQVMVFPVVSGALGTSITYSTPSGSSYAISGAFSPDGSSFIVGNNLSSTLPANNGLDNVSLFSVTNGVFSGGVNYALPFSSYAPYSVAYSPNGQYVVTADADSGKVTFFNVTCAAQTTTSSVTTVPPVTMTSSSTTQGAIPTTPPALTTASPRSSGSPVVASSVMPFIFTLLAGMGFAQLD